jgi:hypothetical protein
MSFLILFFVSCPAFGGKPMPLIKAPQPVPSPAESIAHELPKDAMEEAKKSMRGIKRLGDSNQLDQQPLKLIGEEPRPTPSR